MHWVSWWSAKHRNLSYHQNLLSGQTYPAPRPVSRGSGWTCLTPSPDMSYLSPLSVLQRPNPDMSRPQPRHVQPISLISSYPSLIRLLSRVSETVVGHVRHQTRTCSGFWHTTARFLWGVIKGPPCLSSRVDHSVQLANTLSHSLELPTCLLQASLKSKLSRRDLILTLEWSLNLQLKHFIDDLRVFITLGDLFP
jgi:hypothetical protein